MIGWHFFDIQEKKKQPILKFRKLIYTRGSIHLHRTIGQILRDNISDFNTSSFMLKIKIILRGFSILKNGKMIDKLKGSTHEVMMNH